MAELHHQGQLQRRSRAGCDECRRRHWKCSEGKPVCSYCQRAGRPCVYSRHISWGGRQFKKSRFGKCLSSGAIAVSIATSGQQLPKGKGFVYTCPPKRTNDNTNDEPSTATFSHETPQPLQDPVPREQELGMMVAVPATESNDVEVSAFSSEVSLGHQSLSATPEIQAELKPLFDYFVHGVTIAISCHKGIQDDICSNIVPMAMQVPHLLSATLALAAAHRQTSGVAEGDCQFELMKGKSIKQLRSALDRFIPAENNQVLATTLLLCMAEIISPTANISSWRSHLHGAATLAAQHRRSSGASVSSNSAFLRRKYQALQAVALACGSKRFEGPILARTSDDGDAHIDDLAGYSTNLLPIFEEINNLERLQEDPESEFSCECPPGPPHFECNSPLEHRSHLLFDRIRELIAQRKMSWTKGDRNISWDIYKDLYLLDEAYHHMALLQVFRRGSLSVPLRMIDESRDAILACLTAVAFHANPCPGVAALPPLFVAGIMSTEVSDRNKVRNLLKVMWMNYGMGNVRSCQTVLHRWWKEQDERPSGFKSSQLYNCKSKEGVFGTFKIQLR